LVVFRDIDRAAVGGFASGGHAKPAPKGRPAVTSDTPQDEDARRHRTKMEKRKAAQDAEVAGKTIAQKGLLMVHTGAGKGKSTAAFGLVLRALGHGFKVGVVQFGKGAWETGERRILETLGREEGLVSWHTLGEGFTWETQDRGRDEAAARRAWDRARELMADPAIRLLVLDELSIALRYEHLPLGEVIEALEARRPDLHIVVTGRNAKPELIAAADLVTEMACVKHHFAAGVKAQEGIEW
jgi:cob(I)alamin adenosyltransferase